MLSVLIVHLPFRSAILFSTSFRSSPLTVHSLRMAFVATDAHTAIASRGRGCAGPLIIPGQVGVVTQLSGLDQMRDGEQSTKDDADSANYDVGDAEEGVLSAHDSTSRDDDGLCAAIFGNIEV